MHHSLQGLGRAGRQACAMALHQAQGQRGKYLTLELARTRNPVENLCASVSKFQSAKIGVQWAVSEAAVLCLRKHPQGQQYLSRVEKKHGKGKALSVLAAARTISHDETAEL